MSKHNKLRDKINELFPDLMKLEFGCEIEARYHDISFIQTILAVKDSGNYLVRTGVGEVTTTISPKDIVKILGKDPTLEDVLRAINEVYYGINMTNEGTTVLSDEIVEIIGIWELGTSLKDQSPEVWEAIDSILDK